MKYNYKGTILFIILIEYLHNIQDISSFFLLSLLPYLSEYLHIYILDYDLSSVHDMKG